MTSQAIEIIAEAIEAAGFTAMAEQYRESPEYRERIERSMQKNIANDYGFEAGMKFSRMVRMANMS